MIMKSDHPWQNFLHARALAIHYLFTEMKYTYDEIAKSLSMDEGQVKLILMTEVEK